MALMSLLNLIRWPNLVIIGLTQLIVYFLVIRMWFVGQYSMSLFQFLIIMFITVLLASAGNIINDYYDFDSDVINKKRATNFYSFSTDYLLKCYLIVSSLCFIMIAFFSYMTGSFIKPIFFLAIHVLLWFYSYELKHKAIIGNIVVALLSSLVVMIIYLFDSSIWVLFLEGPSHIAFYLGGIYMFFAFVLSFLREIIKDIEDIEGDKIAGSRTLPLILGVGFSKKLCCLILLLSLIVLLFNTYVVFIYFSYLQIILIIILFVFPHLYILNELIKAKYKSSFTLISKLIKYQIFIALIFLAITKFLF